MRRRLVRCLLAGLVWSVAVTVVSAAIGTPHLWLGALLGVPVGAGLWWWLGTPDDGDAQ